MLCFRIDRRRSIWKSKMNTVVIARSLRNTVNRRTKCCLLHGLTWPISRVFVSVIEFIRPIRKARKPLNKRLTLWVWHYRKQSTDHICLWIKCPTKTNIHVLPLFSPFGNITVCRALFSSLVLLFSRWIDAFPSKKPLHSVFILIWRFVSVNKRNKRSLPERSEETSLTFSRLSKIRQIAWEELNAPILQGFNALFLSPSHFGEKHSASVDDCVFGLV